MVSSGGNKLMNSPLSQRTAKSYEAYLKRFLIFKYLYFFMNLCTLKLFFGIWLPACTENCIHTVSELCECCINMIFLSPAFLSKAPVNKRRETICCVHSALCTAHSETNAQTAPPSAICQAITLYKLASQFWKHIAFGFSSKPTEIVLNIVSQDF